MQRNEIICVGCQKLIPTKINQNFIEDHCQDCNIHYNRTTGSYWFYMDIDEWSYYSFTFFNHNFGSKKFVLIKYEPRENQSKTILKLDYHPNFTPNNLTLQQIETLINFS